MLMAAWNDANSPGERGDVATWSVPVMSVRGGLREVSAE